MEMRASQVIKGASGGGGQKEGEKKKKDRQGERQRGTKRGRDPDIKSVPVGETGMV